MKHPKQKTDMQYISLLLKGFNVVIKKDLIMAAARTLPPQFTIEDLVVAAWKMNKQIFGLVGFQDKYPNNNIIYCCIMGKHGLVSRGELVRNGKFYSATTKHPG